MNFFFFGGPWVLFSGNRKSYPEDMSRSCRDEEAWLCLGQHGRSCEYRYRCNCTKAFWSLHTLQLLKTHPTREPRMWLVWEVGIFKKAIKLECSRYGRLWRDSVQTCTEGRMKERRHRKKMAHASLKLSLQNAPAACWHIGLGHLAYRTVGN